MEPLFSHAQSKTTTNFSTGSTLIIIHESVVAPQKNICDPLREKGEFRAKCIYELRSNIAEYAALRGLFV